jgi:hypothetical protein
VTAEQVLLVLGAGLLVAAERAMSIARVSLGSIGALSVVAAIILVAGGGVGTRSGAVRVSIGDELGPDQVSEEIRVFLDGRDVGVLRVDRRTPKAQLTAKLSRAGRHRYRLDYTRVRKGKAPARGTSESEVVIEHSRPLLLYADDEGNTYLK